jgi:Mannosyltransferase (PIG-M)
VGVRRTAALTAVAVGVFLGSWWLLHHGTLGKEQIRDTPEYQMYGDAIARGAVPYRDLLIEYPTGALPTFVLPSLGHEGDPAAYNRWFERLMELCGGFAIIGVALALRALGAGPLRSALALGTVAVSPLLLGSVMISRFDLWPVALTVLALAALLWERDGLAVVPLGVAISAKLWPAVLAPLAIVSIWRRRGSRAAALWTASLVAIEVAIFLPFAALALGPTAAPIRDQLDRPLQIESLGAAVLLVVHHLAHTSLQFNTRYGSQNIAGSTAHAVQLATTAVEVVAVALAWVLFARGPATRERLVAYAAAAVAAFVAFGKVLSPQFVIWLIPLVPLVRGRRGLAAGALLAAILVLTQSWFPRHYLQLEGLAPTQIWEVLARDLCLVALAVLLLAERRTSKVPAPTKRSAIHAGAVATGTSEPT